MEKDENDWVLYERLEADGRELPIAPRYFVTRRKTFELSDMYDDYIRNMLAEGSEDAMRGMLKLLIVEEKNE